MAMGTCGHCLAGLIWIACVSVTDCVSARDLQPGVLGSDDRRVVDQLGAPWAAIGQVNVSGYRYVQRCTGTLVASNIVITAAHCVMDPWREQPFPLHQIHFLAGVRGSDWLGHSTAKCLHFAPDYEYVGPSKILSSRAFQEVPRRSFSRDILLIVLEDALTEITPMEIARADVPPADIPLVHLSYAADRRYVLTGHFGCHLLARDDDLWFTDCDTHAASSGGPVLVHMGQDLRLAAVMVGISRNSASIAIPTANWIDVVVKRDCP